jgi:excinuclease ABC subunit B
MTEKFKLYSNFSPTGDQPQAIKNILKNFGEGEKFQTLLGVTGSGKTFTMANVINHLKKKTLILAHNKTLAAQLYEEFRSFFPESAVEYFVSYYDYYQPEAFIPGSNTYIEKDASVNDDIDKLRHSTTRSLLEREDVIVISSVSCIYGIGAPEEYGKQKVSFYVGQEIVFKDFLNSLVEIQYKRNDQDFSRGNFRVKAQTVEVFPSHEDELALRIEFLDDEIEDIFLVDPLRGTIIRSLNSAVVYPSSHYVVTQENLQRAIKDIQKELRSRLKSLKGLEKELEANRLSQRTLLDLEMLDEMGYCNGIENYSRHLTGSDEGEAPPTLIDFFGEDFLLIIDESHITVPQVGGMYRGDRVRKETLVEHGFRLPSALDNRPLNFEEFENKYPKVLFVSATPGDYELRTCSGEITEQIIRPTGLLDPMIEVRAAKNQVEDFLLECRNEIAKGRRVLVTTLTKKLSEELTTYYKSLGIKACYIHSDIDALERVRILRQLRSGEFDLLIGINLLREGLDLPEVSLVGILDADKEGFLRSTRSLIQTIGRAARNSDGRVLLYGNTVTRSMQEAIDITENRRQKQIAYNQKHGISPLTIQKEIKQGVLETLGRKKDKSLVPENSFVDLSKLSESKLNEQISELREEMKKFARNLEFEKAAKIRDEIKKLSDLQLYL